MNYTIIYICIHEIKESGLFTFYYDILETIAKIVNKSWNFKIYKATRALRAHLRFELFILPKSFNFFFRGFSKFCENQKMFLDNFLKF